MLTRLITNKWHEKKMLRWLYFIGTQKDLNEDVDMEFLFR